MTPEIEAAATLLAKYAKEAEDLKSENDRLRAALESHKVVLKELVALKEMKDTHDILISGWNNYDKLKEYKTRKPLAWEAARKLIVT